MEKIIKTIFAVLTILASGPAFVQAKDFSRSNIKTDTEFQQVLVDTYTVRKYCYAKESLLKKVEKHITKRYYAQIKKERKSKYCTDMKLPKRYRFWFPCEHCKKMEFVAVGKTVKVYFKNGLIDNIK